MILITIMNVHGLDLNLLRVFDTVLRDRSVTTAARHLGLTQPAVSNALARLRAQFEDALFAARLYRESHQQHDHDGYFAFATFGGRAARTTFRKSSM